MHLLSVLHLGEIEIVSEFGKAPNLPMKERS